jgi:hypothetical protein
MSEDVREELKAETTWFHVFRDMILGGEMAKMGPYGFAVYCVIKAHTDLNDGEAFPGIETIARESGISVPQVKREIPKLE